MVLVACNFTLALPSTESEYLWQDTGKKSSTAIQRMAEEESETQVAHIQSRLPG